MNTFFGKRKENNSTQSVKYTIHPRYRSKIKRGIVLMHLFVIACVILFINSCNTGSKITKDKNNDNSNDKTDIPVVNVEKTETKDVVDPRPRKIYLTFDDGPNKGTLNVVNTLQQKTVPATFFVVGSHIYGSKKQMIDFNKIKGIPYFEAANHSFNHAHNKYVSFYKSPKNVLEDFSMMSDTLGVINDIIRTPGNNSWRICDVHYDTNKRIKSAVDTLYDHDFKVIGWDVEWKANKNMELRKSAADLWLEINHYFDKKLTMTENQVVILLHDQHFAREDNLVQLADFIHLVSNDHRYEFKKVSDYQGI